jgi:hypothetical protein
VDRRQWSSTLCNEEDYYDFSTKKLVTALFGLALLSVSAARADDQHHQPDAGTAAPSADAERTAGWHADDDAMMNMMGQSRACP